MRTGRQHDDRIAGTIAAYDRIAASFAAATASVTAEFAAFRAEFRDLLPARAVVADLGCGPGRDATWFRSRGLDVVGVDLSAGLLALAVRDGVPVIQADIRWPPLRAGSLDGIWSSAALLHVPAEHTVGTLRAWWLLLAPGGILGLSTSGRPGEAGGWEPVTRYVAADAGPDGTLPQRWFAHRRPRQLLAQVAAAGFSCATMVPAAPNWLTFIAAKPD